MNSGRKILRQQSNKKNKKRKNRQMKNGNAPKIIIASIVAIIILVTALVGYDQLRPKLILTVEDEKVHLSDMMYDIYMSEQYYDSMDQYYKSYGSKGFWDSEVSEGVTGREGVKEEVLEAVTQRELLYTKALEEGYTLTDEERETIKTEVEEIRKEMGFKQKTMRGLSVKTLTAVKERDTLAQRYKQDTIDAFPIDDEAIKAGVNAEEFRQYDVQYYSASYQSSETDEEGNAIPVSDEEKAKLKADMETLHGKAAAGEDFTTLIPEGEESSVQFNKDANFIETDENFLSADIRTLVKGMENETVSDVLEDEKGCYIIKMINNNSTARYDSEVEKAIQTEEDKQFSEAYEAMKEEAYIDINYEEWDKIGMGKVTL